MSPRPLGLKILVVSGAGLLTLCWLLLVLLAGGDWGIGRWLVVLGCGALYGVLWSVWRLKRWALWVGNIFAALLGAVFLYSVVTDYGLRGLLLAVFSPAGLPIIWLAYFARPRVRAMFQSGDSH